MRFPLALWVVIASVAPSAAADLEAGRTYRIDPATAQVGFDLEATLHTVHGRTDEVTGEVETGEARDGAWALSGAVRVAAASLDTGNARRDRNMRNESLAVDRYPEILFHPRRLGLAGRTLEGDLTIRDVTKPVSIAVRVEPGEGRLRVEGSVVIAWADYGVPDPSVFLLRVRPTARVFFQVDLVPAGPR